MAESDQRYGRFTSQGAGLGVEEGLGREDDFARMGRECADKAKANQNAASQALLDFGLATQAAERQVVMSKEKELAMNKLQKAFGFTTKDLEGVKNSRRLGSAAKFAFLLVVLGCEIDLYGFILAAPTYWTGAHAATTNASSTHMVMRALLIAAPVAYLIAAGMIICNGAEADESEPLQEAVHLDRAAMAVAAGLQRAGGALPQDPNNTSASGRIKERKIKLKFYHILPVFRMYLVLKELTASDIEGLFRVNALSTFTLGFAQMSCMALGFGTGMLTLDIFIKVGIGAQCLNLSVTLMYFGTHIAERMMNQAQIEALNYHAEQTWRETEKNFLLLTTENRPMRDDTWSNEKKIETETKRVIWAIEKLAWRADIHLNIFTFSELCKIGKFLTQKYIVEFAR